MAAKNILPLQKEEIEEKFIAVMTVEMEMMSDELIILKAGERGKHRLMTEQMAPLKELDSAQELITEEFQERLRREFNYGLQDSLDTKIDRFSGILEEFHYAYERIFTKEEEKTEFLSNLAIKQRWIIHVLELERMNEKKGGDNGDEKIKEQRGELDRLRNKQQADFEDFRRLLHESENELRNTVSKLRKEEDARNELQFKNSNLNIDILKLKEELTTIKHDYQKIVEEKGELKQRLAEVAWNLTEERAKKADVEQPFEIEKPVKQMSESDERDNHSHQQLRNRKNELDEILSRSEKEKKDSIYEKLFKKFGEL